MQPTIRDGPINQWSNIRYSSYQHQDNHITLECWWIYSNIRFFFEKAKLQLSLISPPIVKNWKVPWPRVSLWAPHGGGLGRGLLPPEEGGSGGSSSEKCWNLDPSERFLRHILVQFLEKFDKVKTRKSAAFMDVTIKGYSKPQPCWFWLDKTTTDKMEEKFSSIVKRCASLKCQKVMIEKPCWTVPLPHHAHNLAIILAR